MGTGRSTAAATPSGDVQMTQTQAQKGLEMDCERPVGRQGEDNDSEGDDEDEGEDGEPDWNLFHALQSTRSAMFDLSQSSKTAIPPRNPQDELKAIESSLAGNSGGGESIIPPSSIGGQTVLGTGTGTPGTRVGTPGGGAGYLGLEPVGGRLRTTSHIASSPLAR